ncbi:MAG: hypothetical protein M1383_02440 [Patescibacteria group bacterium]|nr:hypothetical protein [Patescibacteria group bacterium]
MTPEQAEQRVKDSANVLKNNGVELKSHSHDGTVFRYAIRTETGLSRFQGTPAQHEKSFGGNFN